MFSHLLKRVIPFTLTFILGAGLGGFFKMFRSGESKNVELVSRYRAYEYGYGYGHGCDHRRKLLAESKPLVILFKPDARWPRGVDRKLGGLSAWVRVTFGADGKVQNVEAYDGRPRAFQDAAESAARQIQFEPETINGVPVSVTREIEMRFIGD